MIVRLHERPSTPPRSSRIFSPEASARRRHGAFLVVMEMIALPEWLPDLLLNALAARGAEVSHDP
jgi:hypothetical protein